MSHSKYIWYKQILRETRLHKNNGTPADIQDKLYSLNGNYFNYEVSELVSIQSRVFLVSREDRQEESIWYHRSLYPNLITAPQTAPPPPPAIQVIFMHCVPDDPTTDTLSKIVNH